MTVKKITRINKKKWILLPALVVLFAGIGGYAIYTAYAASTYIYVYNSSASDATIKVYDKYHPSTRYDFVGPGERSKQMYNGFNDIRVDVDNKSIDSYKLGIVGNGYGSCHKDSSNTASDPPNALEVRYRNYQSRSCI
jgi:hypothetical protein